MVSGLYLLAGRNRNLTLPAPKRYTLAALNCFQFSNSGLVRGWNLIEVADLGKSDCLPCSHLAFPAGLLAPALALPPTPRASAQNSLVDSLLDRRPIGYSRMVPISANPNLLDRFSLGLSRKCDTANNPLY